MELVTSFERDIDPTLWDQCHTMLEEQGYTNWVSLPDNSLLLTLEDDDVLYFIEHHPYLVEYANLNFIPLTNDSSRRYALYALEN